MRNFFSLSLALGLFFLATRADAALPAGTYLDSCRQCFVQRKVLHCSCGDGRGNWYDTSLRYSQCNADIANRYGKLVCMQRFEEDLLGDY